MVPFSDTPGDTISDWGEVRLIREIRKILGPVSPSTPYGIGDDCAIIPPVPENGQAVVTTDALVWKRHFDESVSPAEAGAKLVKRNLSDLAAMGAKASWMTLNLLAGPDLSKSWVREFISGIKKTGEDYSALLVGGDIAQTEKRSFAGVITAGGWSQRPLCRSGATPGDTLWVTGTLGGSLKGKHLHFSPRIEEGLWLSRNHRIKSCIDVTDGLAKDLPALLPKRTAASLDMDKIPCSREVAKPPSPRGSSSPLRHAFYDGEDYELLFTLDGDCPETKLIEEWEQAFTTRLTRIGRIVPAQDGMTHPFVNASDGAPIPFQPAGGYQHLQP